MTSFAIGLSALRANQFALEATAHNIANAGTEGYHRRSVHLEAQFHQTPSSHFFNGRGVSISDVVNVRDATNEALLTRAIGDVEQAGQNVAFLRRIEAFLATSENTLSDKINNLFSTFQVLTSDPNSSTLQTAVVQAGDEVASTLRQGSQQLSALNQQLNYEVDREIEVANTKLAELQELNQRISKLEFEGHNALNERDQRDQLVNDLAASIGLERGIGINSSAFKLSTLSFDLRNNALQLQSERTDSGAIVITLDGVAETAVGGKLGSMIDIVNNTIPAFHESLDNLAQDLISNIDGAHARGVGQVALTDVTSTRGLSSPNTALVDVDSAVPIEAGELAVSVTDSAGVRTVSRISIDPAVDTLTDVVDRLGAIPGLEATLTPFGTVRFVAQTGFEFDFTSTPATSPDTSAFTGSATPTVSGAVVSASNEDLEVRIAGSGEIGTGDLGLQILASDGTVLRELNIGLGYEADAQLDLGDGLQLSFGGGTVNDGDVLTIERNGTPDETGFLAALGVNSFFAGSSASDLDISGGLKENPALLASGDSAESDDSRNLLRILDRKNQTQTHDGETLSGAALKISTTIAQAVGNEISQLNQLSTLQSTLQQQRDAVSGVDLNEELLQLQEFQRSYEAAARIIQTVDQLYDVLLNIGR